jgi:hypothetical protein
MSHRIIRTVPNRDCSNTASSRITAVTITVNGRLCTNVTTARAIGVSGSERTLVDGSGLGMRSPCEKSRADVVDRWRWWRTREIEPGEAPR